MAATTTTTKRDKSEIKYIFHWLCGECFTIHKLLGSVCSGQSNLNLNEQNESQMHTVSLCGREMEMRRAFFGIGLSFCSETQLFYHRYTRSYIL